MLHVHFALEDIRFIASRGPEKWVGNIRDLQSGQTKQVEWTDAELGAVLALAAGIGEDDSLKLPGEHARSILINSLYTIATPLFNSDDGGSCRMIP